MNNGNINISFTAATILFVTFYAEHVTLNFFFIQYLLFVLRTKKRSINIEQHNRIEATLFSLFTSHVSPKKTKSLIFRVQIKYLLSSLSLQHFLNERTFKPITYHRNLSIYYHRAQFTILN